ncbi:Undecaprenyl phosphate-alpha-4-amino-4-deoxy-L-arabinose arabinosyl transferase [Rubripirellula tenax]|uniref:Undecaprenyl phosphate-alpha-4-amino-4-deoxy-L-arabinose arabinosyl transferase n=1 Tax=Rubripirellula tenax TaxID=2528015 RepID=A0A5C6FG15_9BACT|nr:glycosyltransferase [Rubripirellula tenax]TWU59750.1 Undecaprenyl phosphate-alpha-4-amino-4-deoxy-L-arabinose arabinosyl transferase [Rubripirellula tenax]
MHSRPGTDAAISLVLPAWNECEIITTAIAEADAALRLVSADYEIIVVDDGSTDGTSDLVLACARENPAVRLVRHAPNQGYGAALRSGFAAASKGFVMFTDADCQFDLTELDRFVLLAKDYDIVCGYRIDRKDTALRCIYSRVYNQLVRVLLRTGVRDVDCAMKLFHRDVIQNLTISGNGFLVNSELLTQANQRGYSVVEVGVSHRPRTEGNSTVSITHIPKVLASLARFWWNSVQFPSVVASTEKSPTALNHVADVDKTSLMPTDRQLGWLQVALLAIAALFMFTNLSYPLIDRDETRYAEISREMLATGNWVLPQLNFETYYDKPPLLYWLCAISFKIFGTNEWAARFVPASAALATMAATMFFGSRFFHRCVGLLGGLVLMLSVGFIFTSRYLLLDGVLALLVTLAMGSAYEAIRTERLKLGWWCLSGICCGLAFMTKGPLILVLWLPPVFVMSWISDAHARPRLRDYATILGLVGLVATPWFAAVTVQDANFLNEFFITHNLGRFAGEFHVRPIWYFIPVLMVAGHPWSFLTIPYASFLFGHRDGIRFERPPALGFLLMWSVWCFIFFSMSKCKLPTYLLPAAPAMSLMIGHYLHHMIVEAPVPSKYWFAQYWLARTATVTTCVAGIAFVVYAIAAGLEVPSTIYVWAMLWAGSLVTALLLVNDRRHAKQAWGSSALASFLFAVMVMHHMVPAFSSSQSLFAGSSSLDRTIATATHPNMATVSHEFSEVPFYLERSDIPNFSNVRDPELREYVQNHGKTVLVVHHRITNELLRESLPDGTKIVSLASRGAALFIEATPPTQRLAERVSPTAVVKVNR